jgi:hypothetical protein
MKANRALRISMTFAVTASAMVLASCSERHVEPSPVPTATSRPISPLPLPPSRIDWRDAPITPGDWRWGMEGTASVARFAGGLLVLRCDMASRTVSLQRPGGPGQGAVAMTLLTSNGNRQLTATAVPGPPASLSVSFAARDGMLDAIAFSRGRFAIETMGLATLYVPSWPEISRVVEDCR